MIRLLIVRIEAQLDVAQAVIWYENQGPGLGEQFLNELDSIMKRLVESPFQFPIIAAGIRRGLLRRFPYSVYFDADETRVEVIAVLHQHRHPDTWKGGLHPNDEAG